MGLQELTPSMYLNGVEVLQCYLTGCLAAAKFAFVCVDVCVCACIHTYVSGIVCAFLPATFCVILGDQVSWCKLFDTGPLSGEGAKLDALFYNDMVSLSIVLVLNRNV